MRILVAGASGFIGRAVALTLSEAGHYVTGTYLTHRVWLPWPITMMQVNLTEAEPVQQLIQMRQPQAVVYCASRHKGGTPQERSMGRIDALKVVSNATPGLPFLYLSSRKVETDPHSPYSDAQLCCEYLVERREPRGTVLRLPAIYGPMRRPWLRLVAPFARGRVQSIDTLVKEIMAWIPSSSVA